MADSREFVRSERHKGKKAWEVAKQCTFLIFAVHKRLLRQQQSLSRRATDPLRERLKILRTWLSYLHMRAPVFLLDHMHLVF